MEQKEQLKQIYVAPENEVVEIAAENTILVGSDPGGDDPI